MKEFHDLGISERRRAIHELRDPLNSISLNAALAKQVLERGETELVSQILETIIHECEKEANLIERLLTVLLADE